MYNTHAYAHTRHSPAVWNGSHSDLFLRCNLPADQAVMGFARICEGGGRHRKWWLKFHRGLSIQKWALQLWPSTTFKWLHSINGAITVIETIQNGDWNMKTVTFVIKDGDLTSTSWISRIYSGISPLNQQKLHIIMRISGDTTAIWSTRQRKKAWCFNSHIY